MGRAIAVIGLALGLGGLAASPAKAFIEINTGSDFLRWCDDRASSPAGTEIAVSLYCIGMVAGFVGAMSLLGPDATGVCVPGNAEIGQALDLILKAVRGMPEMRDTSIVLLMHTALFSGWRC